MASNSTLHSGVLHKCGGKVKSWTRRWMVLRSDLSLSYYKDAAKPPLGVISLKDPSIGVRVGQRADCNWPKNCRLERSLVLTTTKRRFYLFAESVEEAQEWLTHLQAAVEQATGQRPSLSNTVPSRFSQPIQAHGSPTGSNLRPSSARFADDGSPIDIRKAKASELALPESVPNRYVPKQYQPKVKRQITGRHYDGSDFSGAESGSDDDDDDFNHLLASGELDSNEFSRAHPIVESFEVSSTLTRSDAQAFSPSMHESLYDVARNPEEITPAHSNSNNNNGEQELQLEYEPMDRAHTLSPGVGSSSTNLHESLYDLVGKINAGEMADLPGQNEGHSRTQSLIISSANARNSSSSSNFSVTSQPPLQQDMYEPIQEQVGVSAARSIINQPLPPVPQVLVSQSLPAHALSPSPLAVYEAVETTSPPAVNFYEEVEKGSRVQEALSSDDESFQHQPSSAAGPALPPKSATLSSHGDEVPVQPPPALPPRVDNPLPVVKPPMRPPLVGETGGHSKSNAFEPAIYDEVATDSSLHNGHIVEDVYDDATSVPASSAQASNAVADEGELYDDATSVATLNDHKPSPTPPSSLQETLSSAESKPESEQVTDKASPGKVKPCPLPRKKRASSQGSGSPEVVPRDLPTSNSSGSQVERSSESSGTPTSPVDTGKGMELFRRRGREISEVERRDEPKNRVMSMLFTGGDGQDVSMSVIAETLREIEVEKQMASEERFRFERERKRLEEEKKEMEREKEELREELERTRALLNANK